MDYLYKLFTLFESIPINDSKYNYNFDIQPIRYSSNSNFVSSNIITKMNRFNNAVEINLKIYKIKYKIYIHYDNNTSIDIFIPYLIQLLQFISFVFLSFSNSFEDANQLSKMLLQFLQIN